MSLLPISLTSFAAIFARCFGVMVCVPWGEAVGMPSKSLLALGTSLMVMATLSTEPIVPIWFVAIEFVIGFVLASPLRLLLDLSEALGEMIDVARGQMISAAVDPLNGLGISDLASLFRLASLAVAIHYGALDLLLITLIDSYSAIKVGALHDPSALLVGFFRGVSHLSKEVLGIAVVCFVALLLIEFISVLCGRAYRGLSWSGLSIILKTLVTFALLGGLVMAHLSPVIGRSVGGVSAALQSLRSMPNRFDRLMAEVAPKR